MLYNKNMKKCKCGNEIPLHWKMCNTCDEVIRKTKQRKQNLRYLEKKFDLTASLNNKTCNKYEDSPCFICEKMCPTGVCILCKSRIGLLVVGCDKLLFSRKVFVKYLFDL